MRYYFCSKLKISPEELKQNAEETEPDPDVIPEAKEDGEEEEEKNDNISNLPTEQPIEIEDEEGKPYYIVPENIQPVMELSTIEVIMKLMQYK